YSTCASQFSACSGPIVALSTVSATPALTTLPWNHFTGGVPVATTNGARIVGLQFQVECPVFPSCDVDLRIGAIVLSL
ncbi:MAG TPA: hypothetical protein VGL13_11335, partial [Polyangiaceae bacterium]